MPPGRILGAILKGISVDHPNGQRAEQIHAGDAQQARKGETGDMHRHRQQKFNGKHSKKRNAVCNQQPDVALNAAVAPDLLIDASAGSGEKDADKADAAVQQNRAPAQMLAAPVQNQQQHIQRQQDQHIVSDQRIRPRFMVLFLPLRRAAYGRACLFIDQRLYLKRMAVLPDSSILFLGARIKSIRWIFPPRLFFL